jgi:hypothetical protein
MRYLGGWAVAAMVLGMGLPGATVLKAEDWRGGYGERRDLREDNRDLARDYRNADRMRADMAGDEWRLNEDIRCGRSWAASRDAADVARDRNALGMQLLRDIHHDQVDVRRDGRDLRYGDREGWR